MTHSRSAHGLRRGWLRPVVAVVVVSVGTAGCSGGRSDDDASAVASSSSTTTTTTLAPAPSSTSTSAVPPTTVARPAASPTTARTFSPAPVPSGRAPLPAPAVVAAPTDPVELGRMVDELVAAEAALRDPAGSDADIPRLARRQQAIYRSLSARPAALSEPAAAERIPEALRPVVEANVTAGAELRAMTKPKTELPPWKIVPPPPAAELEGYYREAEQRYGVPWAYLASVHLVETRMGRIRGTSTAGAQGPMQFLPDTWKRWGEGGNIEDARDSILAAGRYLQASGAPGNMAKALYAYNRSERYVRAVTAYARQMEADRRAYLAYHQWQVYYITPDGDILLAEGYGS